MRWGKKKPPSSSCTNNKPSLMSWLAKLKHMSLNPTRESHAREVKQKEKWSCVNVRPRSPSCDGGKGKFFGGEEGDGFWRPPFGDQQRCCAASSKAIFGPDFSGMEKEREYNDVMKVDVKRLKGLSGAGVGALPEKEREKAVEIRTPRLGVESQRRLRRRNPRMVQDNKQINENGVLSEEEQKPRGARGSVQMIEREDCKLTAFEHRKACDISSMYPRDCSSGKLGEDYMFSKGSDGFSAENMSPPKWQKLKGKRTQEIMQRKSVYISRDLQKKKTKQISKDRTLSPRVASRVESCRIRAIEGMKKAKKIARSKRVEEFAGLESFAVVTCSFDPEKDFRDSMIEMIQEKQISKPEELEELLSCYLTLNSDEYHDLIIMVFRQVWSDLNQPCFDTELSNQEHCYDVQPHICSINKHNL